MAEEVKVIKSNTGIFSSKLQIGSLFLIGISIIVDPEVQKFIGTFIPPEIFSKITLGIGTLGYVIRKYFTGKPISIEDLTNAK